MNEDVKKKRLNRKSKKLIIVLFFTMAFFVVITYAWFIGLSVAKVNTFEIKISANEGLSLSLDGLNFYDEINLGNTENEILENVLNAYPGNPNSWLGVNQTKWNASGDTPDVLENKTTSDLLPVSTNGLIDQNGSVLTLFSKSSMTSSSGGYELTAERYLNKLGASGTYIPDEQKGYIVFNLFIKNNDNTKYIKNYNMFNDEAIYMSTDSSVKLVQSSEYDGESSGGDGLENSLRIAFMQIGRVDAASSQEDVTSITCTTTDKVTGLCNAYSKVTDTEQPDGTHYQKDTDVYESNFNTFAIWEPNDLKHTEASREHFTRICKNRNSDGSYLPNICTSSQNYFDTYVVRDSINASNSVDIYDGLNNYYKNTDISGTKLLQKMSYYTESMIKDGDYRNQIFMLAPNSITLVKVYIYLEGQDVDNYDIDSIGKAFAINFGFTKDKYEDTEGGNTHIAGDINGDGIINDADTVKLQNDIVSLTGTATFDQLDIMDINGDGNLTNNDITELSQYISGTRDTFALKEFHETFPDVNFRKCVKENYDGQSLNCSNMNIKSVKGIETLSFPEMGSITLSHNRIDDNIIIFPSDTNFSYIYLSYNNLTNFDFSNVSTNEIYLEHNKISNITSNKPIDVAYYLVLSHNNLTSLNNLTFSTMSVNLSHNNISSINNTSFSVNDLYLDNNNLTSFSPINSNINDLYLSGNMLRNINLTSVGSYSYIDLENNRYDGCITVVGDSYYFSNPDLICH